MDAGLPVAFLSSPGMGEMLVILAVVLILFGPKKLPEIARTIGRIMEEMRRASQDFRDQLMRIDQPPPAPPGSRAGRPMLDAGTRGPEGPEPRSSAFPDAPSGKSDGRAAEPVPEPASAPPAAEEDDHDLAG